VSKKDADTPADETRIEPLSRVKVEGHVDDPIAATLLKLLLRAVQSWKLR
jgi:hypothetical protein